MWKLAFVRHTSQMLTLMFRHGNRVEALFCIAQEEISDSQSETTRKHL